MPHYPDASLILARYTEGGRSCTQLQLEGPVYDFSGATLVDVDFSDCFVVASFRNANLERAAFRNANVKTCDFSGANLRGASFEGSAIDGAVFTGADLTGASFLGASEQGCIYQLGEFPFQYGLL